jgi:hypothetical protein
MASYALQVRSTSPAQSLARFNPLAEFGHERLTDGSIFNSPACTFSTSPEEISRA